MNVKTTLLSGACMALLFFGCKKSNNSSQGVSYQLKTKNQTTSLSATSTTQVNNTAQVNSTQTTTLSWTSGFAYVTEIKFEADGQCQVENQNDIHKKFETSTPQKIDRVCYHGGQFKPAAM